MNTRNLTLSGDALALMSAIYARFFNDQTHVVKWARHSKAVKEIERELSDITNETVMIEIFDEDGVRYLRFRFDDAPRTEVQINMPLYEIPEKELSHA